MIEVVPHGNGHIWRWLSACGRVLVQDTEVHPCNIVAWQAARDWRNAFWARADQVDHRQARCI